MDGFRWLGKGLLGPDFGYREVATHLVSIAVNSFRIAEIS
jgi:hypothetical protein